MSEPKLQAPGAGIPLIELLVAKYLIFPNRYRTTSIEKAIADFREESNTILELARKLSAEQLAERRLIPRLRGLEDSSRFYSVAMTIEHLVMAGQGVRGTILGLSRNQENMPSRGTAQLKPSTSVDAEEILAKFDQMTDAFVRTVEKIDFGKNVQARHPHPWFGPLTARQWLVFAAPHQNIHRRQIEAIIERL